MYRLALIGLVGALVALSSTAQANWQKGCQSGAAFTTSSLAPGGYVCHEPTTDADSPSVLDISNCENVDIQWFDNITGNGAPDADGTATLYVCPVVAAAAMDTDAERRLACQPMNAGSGTVLSATVTEIYGEGGLRIWADIANASAENQLLVRCSQPSAR